MDIQPFPVLAFHPLDVNFTDKYFNGTAFLINDTGLFYTAGHNFYDRPRGSDPVKFNCYALINGELFPTEEVFLEYDPNSDGIKRDFACGRIKDIKNKLNLITVECDQPIALGYTSRELEFEKLETNIWNGIQFYLYKIPITIGTNSMEIAKNINITFDNVLFYITDSENSLDGLSGGPIIHKDEIVGVLVSHCFITKKYIEETLPIEKR